MKRFRNLPFSMTHVCARGITIIVQMRSNLIYLVENTVLMTKFDGIKGQELLDVEQSDSEVTLIFKDNRYLFVRLENGRIVCESVPE